VDKTLRVAIDTNHIIPAILSKRGASAKLIDWYLQEDYFRLLVSRHIWKEYRTVADWLIPEPKLYEKERVLNILLLRAEWIAPTIQLNACSDLTDNCFLECAIEGRADYLVTKNIKHFPHKEYAGVKIVHIRKLLQVLEKMEKFRPHSEKRANGKF
jgi:putative PIN family toxin of toxin-antitoxin system